MKKVLFAINTLNNGGAEKVLLTLLRYLDPKKYEIHLLVVFGEGIYFEQIPQYVRVTHIFPCKSKEATKEIREHAAKLYEQYVKESYDVWSRSWKDRPRRFYLAAMIQCVENMRGCIRT